MRFNDGKCVSRTTPLLHHFVSIYMLWLSGFIARKNGVRSKETPTLFNAVFFRMTFHTKKLEVL